MHPFRRPHRPLPLLAASLHALLAAQQPPNPPNLPLQPERVTAQRTRFATAPRLDAPAGGLVGVEGGATVMVTARGNASFQLPVPQCLPGQVPLSFVLQAEPAESVRACRLQHRAGERAVVEIELACPKRQEVRVQWAAIVLLHDAAEPAEAAAAAPFLAASPCAQADSDEVKALAASLWPRDAGPAEAAHAIQAFVHEQRPKGRVRSMDALGQLASGANSICTANANLATALLRCRGVAVRQLAVVPPIGQRLEMHRIVEWHADGAWHRFDPSSLSPDVPMKCSASVVMAVTSMDDEAAAMKPRMGSALGRPLGQELEMLTGAVSPWGQDMYWTSAKPIAAFAADAAAIAAARAAWLAFLDDGVVRDGVAKAGEAGTAAEFAAALVGRGERGGSVGPGPGARR